MTDHPKPQTSRERKYTAGYALSLTSASAGLNGVPHETLTRSPLSPDYADHFTRTVETRATPEQYARAMFGDTPTTSEIFIWRGLLQLRLSPGESPDTVAGWQIVERSPEWIRLETRSHSLTVNLVVVVLPNELQLTTLVRYDRPLGQWMWTPLSAVHRRLAPSVLTDAIAAIARKIPPG